MTRSLKKKVDNKFIKKSNVIVRAVTNECAGIITQRLFNFAILSIKKEYKEFNGKIKFWGFLVICVSLFYKVLVQINSVFKFYHKMSNCCISILNRQCSFFCDIFNC